MPYGLTDTNAELSRVASKLSAVRSSQSVSWREPGGMPSFGRQAVQRCTGAPLRPWTGGAVVRPARTPVLEAARSRVKLASSTAPYGASAAEYGFGGASLVTGPVETKPEAKPTKHAKFCGAPNDVFIDWRYKDCSLDMKGRPSTAQRQTALRKRWLNQQLAYDKVLIGDLEAKLAKFDKRREARRVKGAAALQNKRDEEAALHRRFNLPTTGWSKTPSAVGSCLGEESVQGKLYPLASVEDTLQGLERSSARDDGGWDAGEEGDDWGGDGAPALDEADAARQAQQASVVLRTIQAKLHGNGAMLRVTDVFREFDRDFSGTIEIDELRAALVSLGVPLEEHDFQLVRPVFDLNGDGVVDYAEFDKIMKRELVRNPRRASQILRAPDADRPYTPESMQNAKGGSWGHASRWEKKAPAPGSAGSDGGELKGFSDASDSGMQHSKGVTAARVTGGTISRAVR
jgi:hypothetical protein